MHRQLRAFPDGRRPVNHHAGAGAHAWSAGTAPGAEVGTAVLAALAELGVDADEAFPKPVTGEVLAAADVVVTLVCRDTVPLLPGRRYADWPVTDPAGGLADTVRAIRDQIDTRVTDLLAGLPTGTHTP